MVLQLRSFVPSRRAAARLGLVIAGLLVALVFAPHSAKAWWNTDWTNREAVTIDAGPKGAALAQDPGRMPVLLRLHDGNFKFEEAKDDGSDLRVIAGDDQTPLKFHLESFDPVLGVAFLWIDVPAIKTGATTTIWLYWGNAKAPALPPGDVAATYDGDTTLVYHFAERNAPPHDSTANGNNGQAPFAPVSGSQIGAGAIFDGASAIAIPTSPSLTIAQGGAFTWSAWIKPGDPQSNAVIFAKTDGDRSLVIGLDQNIPYVALSDGTNTQRTTPIDAIPAKTWHHLAITASDHVALYVDGQAKGTLAVALPALAGPASLGGQLGAAAPPPPAASPDANAANATTPPAAAAPAATPPAAAAPATTITGTAYAGELDELEIAKTARSAAFIAAAFASQSADSKMVSVGQEEEHAGWFSGGYMGVILQSVTTDGWVVIGMLVVMAAVSWIVMITKAIYVNRMAKADQRFLDCFTRAGGDIEQMDAELAKASSKQIASSGLGRIYRAGTEELARRFKIDDERHLPHVLTPQGIATIRAILDRVATMETQRLNRSIVLLTIAISGGPFLGLLGTVVGVMITFAAIAASGDVNIAAIAPGMAAALVATTAGLAVAIPALFGYNYLLSRIKDATTDMHVFVDEFGTRLAETYRPRYEPLAAE